MGGPSRQVSPSLVWLTIERLTQPPSTDRMWNSSTPSSRGALAGVK